MSESLFYLDKDGRKRDDGLHVLEAADPHGYAMHSVREAIARGISPENAMRRYGVDLKVTPVDHDPFK